MRRDIMTIGRKRFIRLAKERAEYMGNTVFEVRETLDNYVVARRNGENPLAPVFKVLWGRIGLVILVTAVGALVLYKILL